MRVAALQMRSGTDVARNVVDFRALVREAANAGARYVQSPEMTGMLQRDCSALTNAVTAQDDDPLFAAAADLAGTHRIWLHVGSTPIQRTDGRIANRAALFAPDGALVATYDKIHMFDVDLPGAESWRESAVYAAGDRLVTIDLGPFRIGLAICYDLRFAHMFADQARAGATVLTAPSAFTQQTGAAHWHVIVQARAIENGAFLIAAAQGGNHDDGRQTYGHSLIVGPWGDTLAEKTDDDPGMIIAQIDPADAIAARERIPNLQHKRPYQREDITP